MSILNPKKTVELSTGEKIEVRELLAVDGLEFLRLIANKLGAVGNSNETEIRARISDMITGAEEIADFLLHKSCGKPLGWIRELGINDFILVISDAIELNITETSIKKLMGVVNRLGFLKT